MILTGLINAIESNLFSNVISFFDFIITSSTILIGGKKVSDFLTEYQKRKEKAVFCFHSNMEIYILRLERLIKDSNGHMSNVFFLYSAETSIKEKGSGCEETIKKLSLLSESFLNYLSNSFEQIPPVDSLKKDQLSEWYMKLHELVGYLSDFQLYDLGGSIPDMDSIEQGEKYFNKIMDTLQYIKCNIEKSKEEYLQKLK